MIKSQVKLPLSVAFEVVMQGIKIRLGRSIVTTLGVALGIAFLMSILTGIVVKRGVSAEVNLRLETERMTNFLIAEMGPLRGRTVAVVAAAPLSEVEQRFLTGLAAKGTLAYASDPATPGTVKPQFAAGSSAVLVVGGGTLPTLDWPAVTASAGHSVVCYTRAAHLPALGALKAVSLERELQEDEVAARRADAARAAFRSTWIIIISLLVTIICISNSMLMSVTERFREIGTMKCLGALSSFVRQIFLIEASLVGLVGSVAGALIGAFFATLAYSASFGGGLVLASLSSGAGRLAFDLLLCLVAGIVLSIVAALYPATIASRMVPAHALRSNI